MTKRYSRWDRGEPAREWAALTLVHPKQPDLVPKPLGGDLGGGAPFITMSRLPGTPVGPVEAASDACLDAIAEAITRFHRAVAPEALAVLPDRRWDTSTGIEEVRVWAATERATRSAGTDQDGRSDRTDEALDAGLAWIRHVPARLTDARANPVFGRADGNLANLLWDGTAVRLVDFEDAGVSDLAWEVADTVEHLSVWSDAGIDSERLLDRFDLADAERSRVAEYRRLFALFWLLMLLPGNAADRRNPPGTCDRQATRLLGQL